MATQNPLVLIAGRPSLLPAGDTLAGAGGVLSGTATVTVAPGEWEHVETVAATGVTAASRIIISLGAMDDLAENSPEFLAGTIIGAIPATNQITFTLAFIEPQSGPIPLNWSAF